MAKNTTKVSDISGIERDIAGLKDQASIFQNRLNTSPTALGGEGQPTDLDIANQESLQRIQKEIQALENKRVTAKWYGDESKDLSADAPSTSKGLIGSTLDFIARPLYGIVGATKHLVGQGKKSNSILEEIADNMLRDKSTFGDVLKTASAPKLVSTPLGFALDIALDPVNWLTMGSSALIPRLGMGAYKGITTGEGMIKGISSAAKSGVLERFSTLGKYTPIFRKSEAFGKLGSATLKAVEGWENLRGFTAADLALQKGIGIGKYRTPLGDIIKGTANAIPGGNKILDTLWYDPKIWIKEMYYKDVLKAKLGGNASKVDITKAAKALMNGESLDPIIDDITKRRLEISKGSPLTKLVDIDMNSGNKLVTAEEADRKIAGLSRIDPNAAEIVEGASKKIVEDFDGSSLIAKDGRKLGENPYITTNTEENAARVAADRMGDVVIPFDVLEKLAKSGAMDDTGIRWFDNLKNRTKAYEKKIHLGKNEIIIRGKDIMDKYEQGMAIFRSAVVGSNPSSHMYAMIGNLSMRQLATGDISSNFLKNLKLVWNVYHNKPGSAIELEKLFKTIDGGDDAVRFFMEANKSSTRSAFSEGVNFLDASKNYDNALNAGLIPKGIDKKIAEKEWKEMVDELKSKFGEQEFKSLEKAAKRSTKVEAGTSGVFKNLAETGEIDPDIAGGMMSTEAFGSKAATKPFTFVKDKAKEGGWAWKAMDIMMNKMPSTYDTYDQMAKLATFTESTVHGYTENVIKRLSHIVDISPEELALGKYTEKIISKSGKEISTGKTLYRLSPKTSFELANVMYLNYNAMPAAIRVMRNTPIIGSPFVSFMYGMALKTGQTLAYNPSAFNKMTFAMDEFGGDKTPLEKVALKKNIYSYLNKPGMYRVPFFNENPIYLNLTNAIPYYSLGMFGPTETDYGNSFREIVATITQKSPFMKDPVGASIFENIILPLILGDKIEPQGQFGQPLYPFDATPIEKAAYGVRSFSEAFVPGVASLAGLVTPASMAQYMPKYRWRVLSMAKQGKSQIGYKGKEDPVRRTVRSVAQVMGIPVQASVDTTFTKEE